MSSVTWPVAAWAATRRDEHDPRLRTVALTAHVFSSAGWFGAVAAFLALAVAGLISPDAQVGRATLAHGLSCSLGSDHARQC
ncbi:hypothetical protein E3T53_03650 [Cryobacterium psychrophilum]|uniref:Uncharacterized protein n=1 Tax=Cryobacterium psychrophilum TaxID=41988 RepID=A0A4Y8KRG6_9MICO|nr:hypothetical protein E3T53_03650 [Cryobacterium psychrophilum]